MSGAAPGEAKSPASVGLGFRTELSDGRGTRTKLLRLSVGIEDAQDLILDLEQAIKARDPRRSSPVELEGVYVDPSKGERTDGFCMFSG